ncbi:hypothetical protein [Streptomyces virginiae]|uniref:hypothetical protein n=1 Tax=Streptomyces virginiae TaxID=1961 RepID=UPI0036CA6A88
MPVPDPFSLDGLIANVEAELGRTIHLTPVPDQLLAGSSLCGLWIKQEDPELDGPEAAGQYGPAKECSGWMSQASGKKASPENVARAAYGLSKCGQTTDDTRAATVDAVVYSYPEAGTTYALPRGKRALERPAYPNVSAGAKKWATCYVDEGVMFAGPVSGAWRERGELPAAAPAVPQIGTVEARCFEACVVADMPPGNANLPDLAYEGAHR